MDDDEVKELKVKNVRLTQKNRETGEETEIFNANNATVKMMVEKKPDYWYRKIFDRNRDALLHKQVAQDTKKILDKLSYTDEKGNLKAKYLTEVMTVSPKPKTQQSKSASKYKQLIREQMEKRKTNLAKFKDKKLLVFICVYLRKERYEQSDVDNFAKPIIDGMKEYFGDDNKVQTVIIKKKMLDEKYDKEDLDFLEGSLIMITDINAEETILGF